MNDIEQALFVFIKDTFSIGDDPGYKADTNLFDNGFVDSLGAFEIIAFAENNWAIEITQRDLIKYPMNTVGEIAAVIAGKL